MIGMKSKCLVSALAVAIGIATAARIARAQAAAQPAEIRIVVSGVRNEKGSVICSLWSSADSADFAKVGTALHKISVPIRDGRAVCEFKELAAGTYAATVFHDENGNGKFDRRFGFPLEGFGFSDNVHPTTRRPSFDQCEVHYAGNGVLAVPIDMIYR
jgi:uncharacterized protein (DUF2141 family)